MSPARVTLLTDFGTADGYAAAMAGVIAAAAPNSLIEHASHAIEPGDVVTAALSLSRYAFLYPEGTVHLVVVDPGVGTERRALAGIAAGRCFVAPDNGVLTRVLHEAGEWQLVEVDVAAVSRLTDRRDDPSATFHGRDLFAPVAALLARGASLEELGAPVEDPVLLRLPEPVRDSDGIRGEVIQVDRFGNLVTDIPGAWLAEMSAPDIRIEGRPAGPISRTYGDVEPGSVLALVGSLGLLEVSVRDGSAADRLEAGRGARVTITAVSPPATPGRPC